MTGSQTLVFFLIIIAMTARTLALRRIASHVPPEKTALIIGAGTFLSCVMFLPLAIVTKITSLSDLMVLKGNVAGLAKGGLLGLLLIAQQHLIGKSLSATTYVFPLATGGIAVVDMLMFGTPLSAGGVLSITLLFFAGILFIMVGHLSEMVAKDKALFLLMVVCVMGFAVMDKTGIPASGWYGYMLATGLGNMLIVGLQQRDQVPVPLRTWGYITLVWVLPELFFNYAIAYFLSVSYGYLAITLRIPLLMLISALFYQEGRLPSQMAFSAIAVIATMILMVDKS